MTMKLPYSRVHFRSNKRILTQQNWTESLGCSRVYFHLSENINGIGHVLDLIFAQGTKFSLK